MTSWIPENISLTTFVNELLDFFPEPIFITDDKGIILHSNIQYQNLVQKEASHLIGMKYGKALGCKYFEASSNECGQTYYCEICELKKVFDLKVENDSLPAFNEGLIIVRELVINNTSLTKIFRLHIKPLENKDKTKYICLLKNLKPEDLEDFE